MRRLAGDRRPIVSWHERVARLPEHCREIVEKAHSEALESKEAVVCAVESGGKTLDVSNIADRCQECDNECWVIASAFSVR